MDSGTIESKLPQENSQKTFLQRFLNSTLFLFGGAFALSNKYSYIINDGENISMFGILRYNNYTDTWEMDDPLAILNGREAHYKLFLIYSKQAAYCNLAQIICVTVGSICALVALNSGRELYRRTIRPFLRRKQYAQRFAKFISGALIRCRLAIAEIYRAMTDWGRKDKVESLDEQQPKIPEYLRPDEPQPKF